MQKREYVWGIHWSVLGYTKYCCHHRLREIYIGETSVKELIKSAFGR